jgi:hypothetical protein
MIQSTKGKRAANAVQGKYGKGFPSDLVKRSRAMLTALDAAVGGLDSASVAAEHILSRRAGVTIHVQAGQLNDIFTAHAWVSCQGIDMTGGAVAGLHLLDRPVPNL